MPRKNLKAKPCKCNCGQMTKQRDFLPGHDQKMLSNLINEYGSGSILGLEKHLIESKLNREQNLEVA